MVEVTVCGAAAVDVMWPLLHLLMRWCCEQQNVSDARACKAASGGSGDSQICWGVCVLLMGIRNHEI